MDGSPPGSAAPGILQARTLEWVAILFSNAWKWKVKVKALTCVRLFVTPWTAAYQAPLSLGFSRQEYWSGLPFPSLMHESEKWKWSRSVVSDSSWPHGLQPIGLGGFLLTLGLQKISASLCLVPKLEPHCLLSITLMWCLRPVNRFLIFKYIEHCFSGYTKSSLF